MACSTALPVAPGGDFHVPKATIGIVCPDDKDTEGHLDAVLAAVEKGRRRRVNMAGGVKEGIETVKGPKELGGTEGG